MKRLQNIFLFALVGTFAFVAQGTKKSAKTAPANTQEHASSPADLSAKGWKLTLLRTKEALKDKNLGMAAAGLAYYATISFFPVLLGSAALYASLVSPDALRSAIDGLQSVLPAAIYSLLDTQLSPLAEASKGSTIVATVLSVAVLLWTASGGLQNLITATNVAYGVQETRGFVKVRATSVLLSVGMILFSAIALALLLLQADALHEWGLPTLIADLFPYLRWVLLVLLVTVALAFVYRYAPNRDEPRWQWVSWGAVAASIIWLLATVAFFIYAQNFSNFNETYGIFAGLVVLMSWFNVSALIVLLGAQVNNKLEEATNIPTQK